MTDPTLPADDGTLLATVTDWEDPPRGEISGGAPVLAVDEFAVPLDWLLEKATAQKIDLQKLSILALIEAFVRTLETALAAGPPGGSGEAGTRLGPWGDWLVMAATLAWLRSRLLLPPDTRAARRAAHEAEALRQALLHRAAIAAAADWLDRRPQLGRDFFAARSATEPETAGRGADSTDLLRACLVALRLPETAAPSPVLPPLWSVPDAMARIRAMLLSGSPVQALDAYLPEIAGGPDQPLRQRAARASTLLAGLELARDGTLTLDQNAPWTPVLVDPSSQPAARAGRTGT